MKTTILIALTAFFLFTSLSVAGGEKKFGKGLSLKETTKISDILANPDKYKDKKVLVKGPVVDVCKKRGCWIMLGSDKEFEKIRFKVEDGVIVFPMSIKGKTAMAEGTVDVQTLSVEEQIEQGKHFAEEQKTTFDPATVKGPKTTVRIMGEGALVK